MDHKKRKKRNNHKTQKFGKSGAMIRSVCFGEETAAVVNRLHVESSGTKKKS